MGETTRKVAGREKIQAIHSRELKQFLADRNLLGPLIASTLRCHACGTVITLENFAAVTRKDGQLLFSCRKEACVRTLAAT